MLLIHQIGSVRVGEVARSVYNVRFLRWSAPGLIPGWWQPCWLVENSKADRDYLTDTPLLIHQLPTPSCPSHRNSMFG